MDEIDFADIFEKACMKENLQKTEYDYYYAKNLNIIIPKGMTITLKLSKDTPNLSGSYTYNHSGIFLKGIWQDISIDRALVLEKLFYDTKQKVTHHKTEEDKEKSQALSKKYSEIMEMVRTEFPELIKN